MESLKILKSAPPQAERQTRRDARLSVTLPLRITTGSGDMIPAVVLNVSVSGLSILVDERTSLLLPPPRGSRFDSEFFFEEIEIPQITLEITRAERRGKTQFILGCKFIELPAAIAAALRAKVTARFTPAAQRSR